MIVVNDSECRNLQQQVAKNANDIAAIHKDHTVTIYTYNLTNDVDPNQPIQFSGTITLLGNVVIAVNGVVIVQTSNKYPVVAFEQINEIENTIKITGTGNTNVVTIYVGDYDAMNEYKLY